MKSSSNVRWPGRRFVTSSSGISLGRRLTNSARASVRATKLILRRLLCCNSNSQTTEARDGALFVHREGSESHRGDTARASGLGAQARGGPAGSQNDRGASPGGEVLHDHADAHVHTDKARSEHRGSPTGLPRITRRSDRHAIRAYAAEFGAAAPFVWRLWIGQWPEALTALLDALGWLQAEEIWRAETEIRLARMAGKISREEEAEGQKALDVARRLARRQDGQAPPTNTPPTERSSGSSEPPRSESGTDEQPSAE